MPKKIIINITVILLLLITFDFFVFCIDEKKLNDYNGFIDSLKYYVSFYGRPTDNNFLFNEYILGKGKLFRRIENPNSEKKPILLFGCSYTYGHEIPYEKTFGKLLANYTDCPVYNRSHHGFGMNQMLYQLENDYFYYVIPEPEYIIYTYIDHHKYRLYIPIIIKMIEYSDIFYKKQSDGKLVLKRNKIFKRGLISVIKLKSDYYKSCPKREFRKIAEFMKLHLLQAKQDVDKHWKNTKFIIFKYDDSKLFDYIAPDLKEAGYIIIDRKKEFPFGEDDKDIGEYQLKDEHPNEKAWGFIVPKLIKKLEEIKEN